MDTMKVVPIIYLEPRGLHNEHFLKYTEAVQLRARTLDKERVAEILNTAHIMLRIVFKGQIFLAGKGILCLFDDETKKIEILFCAVTLFPKNLTIDPYQLTFYISKTLREKANRHILEVIDLLIADNGGDIIFTNNVSDYVGCKVILPHFQTLKSRLLYVDNLIDFCFATEKAKFELTNT
jgi:hypothetical protein